jgi:predicted nucleic-acid-binding protein
MTDDDRSVVSAFADTNVIIRYVLRDMPDQAERIRQIVEDHPRLLLTAGTIAEVAFVLTRVYKVPREIVVDVLVTLLQRSNIAVHQMDTAIVIQALMLCRPSGRVAFADAMLWASVRSAGPGATVYTLDRRFPSVGITVRSELPAGTASD